MTTRTDLASTESRLEWSNDRGSLAVELRGPSVLLITLKGHADSDLGKRMAAAIEQGVRERARHVFVDAGELTSYHSDARTEGTRVVLEQKERVLSVQVYARSKLVMMGISVAKIALGSTLVGFTERSKFLRALSIAQVER